MHADRLIHRGGVSEEPIVGVYDVGTRRAAVDVPRPVDCPYPDLTNPEDTSTHWQTDPSSRTLKIDS